MLCVLPYLASAQQRDTVKRADVLRFADGILYTYTAPVRWKQNDWMKFAGVIGGTVALTLADQPVRAFWEGEREKALDRVNRVGYHYGKPYCGFVLAGGMYSAGLLFKNEWFRETGLALTTALASSGMIEMALKPLIGRARPSNERGNYVMDFMSEEASYHSFPSGHASLAFTISFVMAKRVESTPLKVLFYSLAGSTAICRMYSDAHWISDIAFGGALAWYCSEAVVERLDQNRTRIRRSKTKLNVTPYPGGVTLRATFQ